MRKKAKMELPKSATLETKLDVLLRPVILSNIRTVHEVDTVGDLIQLSEVDLLKIDGLGKGRLNLIRNVFNTYGFRLNKGI